MTARMFCWTSLPRAFWPMLPSRVFPEVSKKIATFECPVGFRPFQSRPSIMAETTPPRMSITVFSPTS